MSDIQEKIKIFDEVMKHGYIIGSFTPKFIVEVVRTFDR